MNRGTFWSKIVGRYLSRVIRFVFLAMSSVLFVFFASCSISETNIQTTTPSDPARTTPTMTPIATAHLYPTTSFSTQAPQLPEFSVVQVRGPSDTDGRIVLTAFWSREKSTVYYALVKEYFAIPFWFESRVNEDKSISHKELSSPPKIMYAPNFPTGSVYLEYRGTISPSGRYYFQIEEGADDSLFLLDSIEQTKIKLLTASDMNFRDAFWFPEENKVAFGIGPEYGTELYLYDKEEENLLSFDELFGYTDPNVSEWVLSPDGKYVAILDGNQNLVLYSLEDSFSVTISGYLSNVRWAANSQKIFYYSGNQPYDPTNISYFDVTTKTAVDLIPLSELEKFGVDGFFDVSPDGTQLVFWQAGDIWLLSFR